MLERFRDDSQTFFRGNDSEEAYKDQLNSGLLILTRAYHANHGFDTPDAADMDAVSTVLNWMVKQEAEQVSDASYAAKAQEVADQLVAKGGLSAEEREGFLAFAQLSRQNAYIPGSDADAGHDQVTHG